MSERGVWVFDKSTQSLVPKHLYQRGPVARSELGAPMLIRDTMEPTWNPVNGQRYDSKRAYEKAVRAAGCEIIGNEKPKASPQPSNDITGEEIKQAIEMVEAKAPTPKKGRKKRGRI